jgi:hypothetical protein
MVYADVPEHEGFEAGEVPEKLPATPTATDQWLARISGQLQDLVDGVRSAIADADFDLDDEPDADQADGSKGTPAGGGDPAAGQGTPATSTERPAPQPTPEPAKKTTAPAKRAEVKGD